VQNLCPNKRSRKEAWLPHHTLPHPHLDHAHTPYPVPITTFHEAYCRRPPFVLNILDLVETAYSLSRSSFTISRKSRDRYADSEPLHEIKGYRNPSVEGTTKTHPHLSDLLRAYHPILLNRVSFSRVAHIHEPRRSPEKVTRLSDDVEICSAH
jgi:hypothetical protein